MLWNAPFYLLSLSAYWTVTMTVVEVVIFAFTESVPVTVKV
jgi:hypothetical protein